VRRDRLPPAREAKSVEWSGMSLPRWARFAAPVGPRRVCPAKKAWRSFPLDRPLLRGLTGGVQAVARVTASRPCPSSTSQNLWQWPPLHLILIVTPEAGSTFRTSNRKWPQLGHDTRCPSVAGRGFVANCDVGKGGPLPKKKSRRAVIARGLRLLALYVRAFCGLMPSFVKYI